MNSYIFILFLFFFFFFHQFYLKPYFSQSKRNEFGFLKILNVFHISETKIRSNDAIFSVTTLTLIFNLVVCSRARSRAHMCMYT